MQTCREIKVFEANTHGKTSLLKCPPPQHRVVGPLLPLDAAVLRQPAPGGRAARGRPRRNRRRSQCLQVQNPTTVYYHLVQRTKHPDFVTGFHQEIKAD